MKSLSNVNMEEKGGTLVMNDFRKDFKKQMQDICPIAISFSREPFENCTPLRKSFESGKEFAEVSELAKSIEELLTIVEKSKMPAESDLILFGKMEVTYLDLVYRIEYMLVLLPAMRNHGVGNSFQTNKMELQYLKRLFLENPTKFVYNLKEFVSACQKFCEEAENFWDELDNIIDIPSFGKLINIKDMYVDFLEARDLFSIGYFVSGVFVVGKMIEAIYLRIYIKRNIRFNLGGQIIEGSDVERISFSDLNEILYRTPLCAGGEKIINRTTKDTIKALISYRNATAHPTKEVKTEDFKKRAFSLANLGITIVTELDKRIGRIHPNAAPYEVKKDWGY